LPEQTNTLVDHFFRHEYGRIVSKLTRALGLKELEFAEDCVQTAMLRAVRSWTQNEFPGDPAAWLYTVSKNIALDSLRQRKRHQAFLNEQLENVDEDYTLAKEYSDELLSDDHLRLLFLCADPEIPMESRLALALKIHTSQRSMETGST
jgi:RNA polymerase sigma-70 factor (ECF subfamily)